MADREAAFRGLEERVLEAVAEAHRLIEEGKSFGKVVLLP